jgi:hypothetical protein
MMRGVMGLQISYVYHDTNLEGGKIPPLGPMYKKILVREREREGVGE